MSRNKSLSKQARALAAASSHLSTAEFVDQLFSLPEFSGCPSSLSPVHQAVAAGRAVWVPAGDGEHQVIHRL